MHLVQLLLPRSGPDGRPFPREDHDRVREELTGRFGGVTAYVRAPAEGTWQEAGAVDRDQILLFEVMVDDLDRAWWADYRRTLERRFRQEDLVVRAWVIERL